MIITPLEILLSYCFIIFMQRVEALGSKFNWVLVFFSIIVLRVGLSLDRLITFWRLRSSYKVTPSHTVQILVPSLHLCMFLQEISSWILFNIPSRLVHCMCEVHGVWLPCIGGHMVLTSHLPACIVLGRISRINHSIKQKHNLDSGLIN